MIQKTFEELKLTGELPSPSGVGMQILKLTKGDDFSTEEIAQTISADSALTGRLLKLANSAEAGSLKPVTTVNEATIRLGIRTVRNVALGLSLVSANRAGECAQFDYDRYWARSLARAVASQRLSRELRVGVPAEMYILGLLCDVGSLALACVHPERYGQLIQSPAFAERKGRLKAESELFEIDHLEVSACILAEWGLPDSFAGTVRKYELIDLGDKGVGLKEAPALLQAADRIARYCIADDSSGPGDWQELQADLQSLQGATGFEEERFEQVLSGIAAEWREWGQVLKIPTQNPVRLAAIEEKARAEPVGSGPDRVPGPRSTPSPVEPLGSAHAGLRILAVDDDPVSLRMLERHLQLAGHQVTTARDGEEALQLALEECPQLVVSDWNMPRLDGMELCQALRRISSGRRIYYLLLTGRGDDESIVYAFDQGVDDYVVKPFKPRMLLARILAGNRIISLQAQLEQEQAIQRRQNAELQILTRKLRSAALTDPLTELPNRRYAMKRLSQSWASCSRTGKPVSLIMLDIDHFKAVNDEHGHDAGDAVLKETARCIREVCREDEDVCRIGGEEFLVICNTANAAQGVVAAERIRAAVEQNVIRWAEFNRAVTLSLGVASREPWMESPEEMMKSADRAVYRAKAGGRNQVVRAASEKEEGKAA